MPKRRRAALLPTNLLILINLIKRDPSLYYNEFLLQLQHYESQKAIFMNDPATLDAQGFVELIDFLAHAAFCYPKDTSNFADDLKKLLHDHHSLLSPFLNEKLISSLVLLSNRNLLRQGYLVEALFPLLSSLPSKALRKQVFTAIIRELVMANRKCKSPSLNKSMQALLFNVLKDETSENTLWVVKISRELWRRGVWKDSRTVEILKTAALIGNCKIMTSAIKFFLANESLEEEEESSDEDISVGKIKHQLGINKKKKSRQKQADRAISRMRRKEGNKADPQILNFSAIQLLRDPQGFADTLFSRHLSQSRIHLHLEDKILVLTLISRLISSHKLSVLSIYSLFLKYLTPKQPEVTQFLACAAQATHEFVPPDVLDPVVKKIAAEFVSEGVAGEVAAVGLNAIREICARAPLAMNSDLLHDLIAYKGSKDKSVMSAARSLLAVYRDVAPEMLPPRERGKEASTRVTTNALRFGEEMGVKKSIEGLELLEDDYEDEIDIDNDSEWKKWDVESDDDSDEDGWQKVSDECEIVISDDEDESKNQDDHEIEEQKVVLTMNQQTSSQNGANMATTRILTPADFKKMKELRIKAGLEKALGQNRESFQDEVVDSVMIEGPKAKLRNDRESKLLSAAKGREGRANFSSHKGKIDHPHSTTNREKSRQKNFLMTVRKKAVRGKAKRSLRQQQRILRKHVQHIKKQY